MSGGFTGKPSAKASSTVQCPKPASPSASQWLAPGACPALPLSPAASLSAMQPALCKTSLRRGRTPVLGAAGALAKEIGLEANVSIYVA